MIKTIIFTICIANTLSALIFCSRSTQNNDWSDPETWENGIVPSVHDIVLMNNCNITINHPNNITIIGIYISLDAKLNITGNLTITHLIENNGNLYIDKTGNIHSLTYFYNYNNIICHGKIFIYSIFYNFYGHITLKNSTFYINCNYNVTRIGRITMINSIIKSISSLIINFGDEIFIIGDCLIINTIINNYGNLYIYESSTLHVESYTQYGSILYISVTGLLNTNILDINSSLVIYPNNNHNKIINSSFITAKNNFRCYFENVKNHILENNNSNFNKIINIYFTNNSANLFINYQEYTLDYIILIGQIIIISFALIFLTIMLVVLIKHKLNKNINIMPWHIDDLEFKKKSFLVLNIINFIYFAPLSIVFAYYMFLPKWINQCSKSVFDGVIAPYVFRYMFVILFIFALLILVISYIRLKKCKYNILLFFLLLLLIACSLCFMGIIFIICANNINSPLCSEYKHLLLGIGSVLLIPPIGLFIFVKL